jgi:hypothetical protein
LIVKDGEQPTADAIAMKYLHRYLGARELLHDELRWCLWLLEAKPKELSGSKFIRNRVAKVREFRSKSSAEDTRRYADQPFRFFRIPQPEENYVAIPRHVSANRQWFTVGHYPPTVIASDALFTAVDPDGFLFGVLSSAMFIAWLRCIGGTIKSDLRFSGLIVYNTFPLPKPPKGRRENVIAEGAQILEVRARYPDTSLADLYDPLSIPGELVTAHQKLDRAVDRLFRPRGSFTSESQRQTELFTRYASLVGDGKLVGLE